MLLRRKKYGLFDFIIILFRIAPIALVLIMTTAVSLSFVPMFTMLTTANFIDTVTKIFGKQLPMTAIYGPLVWVAGVIAYDWVIQNVTHFAWVRQRVKVIEKWLPALNQKKARLEYRHIENPETWDLLRRVSEDSIDKVIYGYVAIHFFVETVARLGGILVVFITQVWWAAIVIVLLSVPLFIITMKNGRSNYAARKSVQSNMRKADYYSEVLTGRETAEERSLFRFTAKLNAKWKEQFEYSRTVEVRTERKNFINRNLTSLCSAGIWFIIAFSLLPMATRNIITLGMYIALIGSVTDVVNTLSNRLGWSIEGITGNHEYLKDLTAFMALEETEDAACVPADPPVEIEKLSFLNVSFAYPGTESLILNNFSCEMKKGVKYAFVGANGAGKTTVTKLLMGLYDNYTGDILINGKELRTYSQAEIKSLFSIVHQDFARYFVSLRDNIGLGNVNHCIDGGSDQINRIDTAVHLVELDDEVQKLGGLETPLGKIQKNGQDISGGQWQRVAIARAIVSDASFTILDEPTAALDPVSESNVYSQFKAISRGHTSLFISHRLGSTKLADRIFVLDGGKVAEEGSHEELMALNGLYAEMYDAQRSWYTI